MDSIRVAVAQLNSTVGDIRGNRALIVDAIDAAVALDADVVAFPELCVTGYPPEDLLLSDAFIDANLAAVNKIVAQCKGIVAAIGFVDRVESSDGSGQPSLYNAAAIAAGGELVAVHHKHHLPNYGVFDERRYFAPGSECQVVDVNGVMVGFSICEDIWVQPGPADAQCAAGAQLVVSLNASPFEVGKLETRFGLLRRIARRYGAAGVYVHQVGGQDELVFDGGGFVMSADAELQAVAPQWEEAVVAYDVPVTARSTVSEQDSTSVNSADDRESADVGPVPELPDAELLPVRQVTAIPRESARHAKPALPAPKTELLDEIESVYRALVVGTRDYVRKTGFSKVAVAISGGIDSALVATIATDALGSENVVGVNMPSRYSSAGSVSDSDILAANLGIPLWDIPIEPAHCAFETMLADEFAGTVANTAEENVQSRIRGNVMMTIANKFGWLVLTTGNKSEMATGYATLYGDMAGGFAVIKDIPKTLVYDLARHRNSTAFYPANAPIPDAIIEKPPSAELKPDQTDQDSLPDYPMLDAILAAYIEQRKSADQVIRELMPVDIEPASSDEFANTVRRVVRMVDVNEYKRRQSPPGVKITGLAFGRDRRMPIASGWRGR